VDEKVLNEGKWSYEDENEGGEILRLEHHESEIIKKNRPYRQ